MTTIYVQFSDSTNTQVVSVFACPQDPAAYPNQAAIEDNDARYQAFINPGSTVAGRNNAINAQIAEIELQYLTNRGVREFCMAAIMMQATATGKSEEWLLDAKTGNQFYKKLKAIDEQIRALRNQLQ